MVLCVFDAVFFFFLLLLVEGDQMFCLFIHFGGSGHDFVFFFFLSDALLL